MSEKNKYEWSTGDSMKWWRKFEHWLFKIMTIDWQAMIAHMITIHWQVIAQYDNDRLTSNDAIWSR